MFVSLLLNKTKIDHQPNINNKLSFSYARLRRVYLFVNNHAHQHWWIILFAHFACIIFCLCVWLQKLVMLSSRVRMFQLVFAVCALIKKLSAIAHSASTSCAIPNPNCVFFQLGKGPNWLAGMHIRIKRIFSRRCVGPSLGQLSGGQQQGADQSGGVPRRFQPLIVSSHSQCWSRCSPDHTWYSSTVRHISIFNSYFSYFKFI